MPAVSILWKLRDLSKRSVTIFLKLEDGRHYIVVYERCEPAVEMKYRRKLQGCTKHG